MMTIEEMKNRKRALNLTNQELARKAGVPLATVAKVLSRATKSPRINTMQALEKALSDDSPLSIERTDQEKTGHDPHQTPYPTAFEGKKDLVQEASGEYIYGNNPQNHYGLPGRAIDIEKPPAKRPGRKPLFTVEDYLALPAEQRVELIDGRFYDMASPNGIHQQIIFLLWKEFFECIETHQMSCRVQGAPFDVQLDDHTVVQPDVMVFCEDPSQAFAARATTPPDLIVEVLSKSTAFKDRHLKLFKYRSAGVREVWLISPENQSIEVYLFSNGEEDPITYSFDDLIPVHISEEKCRIDFSEIHKRLPAG